MLEESVGNVEVHLQMKAVEGGERVLVQRDLLKLKESDIIHLDWDR